MDDIPHFIATKIIFPLLVLFILFVLVGFAYGLYDAVFNDHPSFSLQKKDWICYEYKSYTTTMLVPVGKVMVPQTTTHNDCVLWRHK